MMWLWGAGRLVASGVLALRGRVQDKERLAYWGEVWRRRRDWMPGY
jgi:hypothetical protein